MSHVVDPEDPDHRLVWPRTILEGELDRRLRLADTARGRQRGWQWTEGASRLLRAAFAGPGLAEEFDAQGTLLAYNDTIDDVQVEWLRRLRSDLDAARPTPPQRPYWSTRKGTSAPQILDLSATIERFVSLVGHLDRQQSMWSEAFGVDCPDGVGDPIDSPSVQFEDRLGRVVAHGVPWPLTTAQASLWTQDDFFDIVEVLYDLASWPSTWSRHDFGGCIGHPGDFSMACGRALYRHHVNELLERSDLGVRLAASGEDEGRIVLEDGAGLSEVIDHSLESAPDSHRSDVEHAIALFRSRDRDVQSMRSAIVTLAGVAEAHRGLLKAELLKKDEAALFFIANEFDLRHREANQRTDYDPMFLEWLFHWYLATTALIAKLVARQDG